MTEFVCADPELEKLNAELNDPKMRAEYATPLDAYRPGIIPSVLGWFLVSCGNLVYGKKPSYLKFRAVEVIARVPYHSWESAAFTFLTMFHANESHAMKLSKLSWFARTAKDNETMHVVVISMLAVKEQRSGFVRHTLVPVLFAFVYFWVAYVLYLLNRRAALELNFMFEKHAYEQYSAFLEQYGEELKKKPVMSDYLLWYGRDPKTQYEFFESVRNDELIHRNRSIHEIESVVT
jgi:ubiquinol oxidase